MERRRFLSLLGALPLAAAGASRAQAAALADAQAVAFGCTPDAASANVLGEWWRRTLVLVELEGGNDGLNTVVPFADAAYYRLRPKLAIKRERVIQADERLGFNAALEPLMPWWRRCQMAVVLGVGYPQPNLSHFRSVEIWETASESEEYLDSGWVAQLASGLAAFAHSMETAGLWDRVLVMTYSEFGRRAGENGSAGTDHGTAAPHLMMGGRIRGGFYGEQPPLDGLADGNLAHRVHFRRLYATVAREWWGLEAPAIAERPLGCIA